ncbi:hypothetical protein GCM10007320_66280 [Pseudorhodoferax aquiterrae]|uniref:Uncharacterized protein n=1 Tax=Pseudorhodoferax aquiterrae TaxID=747304 RepID=A0ABQ3GHZ7_9BURK|nr:hypothetical protein [Pseudorhodoferax aquiterrae]GHD04890.1 hypothetical protein GCM10007320_66280 [Pseudorhodoferax aquiterrae]
MSQTTRSQRIINALNQLQQFLPAHRAGDEVAIHVLTGASVTAVASDDAEDGMLFVRFPGGESVQVIGDLYLELQVTESARLVVDGPSDGSSAYAKRSAADLKHFRRKSDLE